MSTNHNQPPVIKQKLSNGLEVLAIPSRQAPVVSLQGWIRFGAADETDDIAGVAHLFEHLLFKGTKKRSVGQIAREVEGLGGDLNAYTSYDQTVMHMTLPSRALEQGIDILSDSLLNSEVDLDELERERPVILEEIKRRNDMPGSKASDLLRTELFNGHPYARPVIGYASVVEAISREKILEQYKLHYNAKNLFLVVCGDFESDELFKTCERHLATLGGGPVPGARPKARAVRDRISSFKKDPSPDAILNIGWQGPDGSNAQVAALDALALIVGQGESSRLVQRLIHKDNLLREIGAGCWSPKDAGSFMIGMKGPAGTSKKFPRIVTAIRECLEPPISVKELDKAKKNLLSSATYSKETVDGLAQRYGYYECIANDWQMDGHYLDQVHALTVDDLEKVKEKFLGWEHAVSAGIVPERDQLPVFEEAKPVKAKAVSNGKGKQRQGDVTSFDFHGLRVLVKDVPQLPIFSARWVGLGGSRLESATKCGIGSLWARSVSNGGIGPDGRIWNRKELNEMVDRSSASLSAFHGRNSYGFQLDGLSEDFENLFELLIGIKDRPLFDKNIVHQERDHLLADIKSMGDNPGSVVSQTFMEALFGKSHPYGRPSAGWANTVHKLNDRDLQSYHKQLMAEPQVLAIVGDVKSERVSRMLEDMQDNLKVSKGSKLTKTSMQSKKFAKPQVLRKKLKKEQTHILLGYPSCTIYQPDRWALLGLSSVLSGQGGRLFIELRDKLSLAYTVAPTHMEGLQGGYFGFYIATSPEKEKQAVDALKREIHRLVKDGVPTHEWEQARSFYTGNHEIDQQRLSTQAIGMSLDELYGFGYADYFRFAEHLNKLKAEDLSRVARKYFDGKDHEAPVTAVVGPS